MYKYQSKTLSTALLLLVLPLAGCASDNMFADESITPYGGSKLHPIKVVNGKAVVENCGEWPKNLADTEGNEMAANHGCAVQANIAAMAAYPDDLIGGNRNLPPPLGSVQHYALKKLETPAGGGSSGGGSGGTPAAKP